MTPDQPTSALPANQPDPEVPHTEVFSSNSTAVPPTSAWAETPDSGPAVPSREPLSNPTAESDPEPPVWSGSPERAPQQISTSLRAGGLVWGLIVIVLGILVGLTAFGFDLSIRFTTAGVLGGIGVVFLIAALIPLFKKKSLNQ